jgi:quinol monooxygenase YgiN
MSDFVVVAMAQAKPGFEAALVAAQAALVLEARKQPGCILYELHEDDSQPGKVVFFERWRDQAAWQNHITGPHIEAFKAKAGAWVAQSELLQMHQVA